MKPHITSQSGVRNSDPQANLHSLTTRRLAASGGIRSVSLGERMTP